MSIQLSRRHHRIRPHRNINYSKYSEPRLTKNKSTGELLSQNKYYSDCKKINIYSFSLK